MTPKEKAEFLVREMDFEIRSEYSISGDSIRCALIAVKEIIKDRERLKDALFYALNYWIEVEKEINNL